MTTARTATTRPRGGDHAIPAWRDYVALVKPRITLLVLVTAAAGFHLGSSGGTDLLLLFHTLLGTALVASGTSAMNQVLERDVDARMERTRDRPLPAGRLAPLPAGAFAVALSLGGTLYLAATTNALTALLAGACFLVYDLLYTPLKRVHPTATLVGAVPGALPVAGGWTAATGRLDAGAWILFGIMFLWQLPHFLALAYLFRDDYRRAGLRMLSVEDPEGWSARRHALGYALALVPVSLLPSTVGLAGALYASCAVVLGGLMVWQAGRFFRDPSRRAAGRLFRYTVLYLPLLLGVLVADKASPASAAESAALQAVAGTSVAGASAAAEPAAVKPETAETEAAETAAQAAAAEGATTGAATTRTSDRGYLWGSLFLMIVPYLAAGAIGGGIVLAWRRAAREEVERALHELVPESAAREVAPGTERPG